MKSRAASRAKGNARENEAQAYLEGLGYLVDRAVQSGYRVPCAPRPCKPCKRCQFSGRVTSLWLSRSNDRWGVFDLLAEGHDQPRLLCVQVTYATQASARRRKILDVAHRFNLDRNDIQLWIWHDASRHVKHSMSWTAERLVVEAAAPGLFHDPTVEQPEGERQYPKRTFRFEKLGYIDIPRGKPSARREETTTDGEGTDVPTGEEHGGGGDDEEEGTGEAEADPFA